MKIAVFSTKPYDKVFHEKANENYKHQLVFFDVHLNKQTVPLVKDFTGICIFVNDKLDKEILEQLSEFGIKLIALRCAGFNNVDINAASNLGITVVRVPAYSPHAVAEHTVGLMLTLNRKIHKAYNRIREGNFALDGLLGFDMNNKIVGIIGTGKIGNVVAKILNGFGCKLLAYDLFPNEESKNIGVKYVSLSELYSQSDIITLHIPLTPETYHLINQECLRVIKNGAMLINTSRGALIDTQLVIEALKTGKISYLGLDVYEEEADIFFEDLSGKILQDDIFARLITFPNVIITGHQAFLTENALENIADTTLKNITEFEQGKSIENIVKVKSNT